MHTIFNESQEQEQGYLQSIIQTLTLVRDTLRSALSQKNADIKDAKNTLWDNARDLDHAEKAMVRQDIDQNTIAAEFSANHVVRIAKLCESPYFGRIDFSSNLNSINDLDSNKNKPPINPMYIGIYSYNDPVTHQPIIYDWRAPISALFYDFELGDVHYDSPNGVVNGYIHLKRQYRIRQGVMEYMLQSSLSIHDDVLQKELEQTSDDKMRNIVATIQRDQNAIIRNESSDTLIIQGVAGSGKSSIALHRVAFLLYRNKETLSSKDILIVSPNAVFSDYIANVLPELGEDNIPEMQMDELATYVLGNKIKYESFLQQVSRLVEKPDEQYAERIRFKSSPEFLDLLNQYIKIAAQSFFVAKDVTVGPYVIPANFIARRKDIHARLSVSRCIKGIVKDVIDFDARLSFTQSQQKDIQKQIASMFTVKTPLQHYKAMYTWIKEPHLFKSGTLEYADVFPLVYITMRLSGYTAFNEVKHLLVDEMQDYTPVQYQVLKMLFPCRKTILGDASQKINPYSSSTHQIIQNIFTGSDLVKLSKSYRSSFEITNFAQQISADPNVEPVQRHGQKPQVFQVAKMKDMQSILLQQIKHFNETKMNALSIICKTRKQCQQVYEWIAEDVPDAVILDENCTSFATGVSITTAYLAKGLEFDEVIIPFANEQNYHSELDKGLLYIACTRAMHRLHIIVPGQISPLLLFTQS